MFLLFGLIKLLEYEAEPDLYPISRHVDVHPHDLVLYVLYEELESPWKGLEKLAIYGETLSLHLIEGVLRVGVVEEVQSDLSVARIKKSLVCHLEMFKESI